MDTTAPGRVTKRRAETRARLLDAAFGVFADRGFGAVRIQDVCAAAGYTRGAFYSQFDSLEQLFLALFEQHAERVAEQLAGALRTVPPGAELSELLDVAVQALPLDRTWVLVQTDAVLHAARHPEFAEPLTRQRQAFSRTVRMAVEQGAADLPTGLLDVATLERAVTTAADGVAQQLLLNGDEAGARDWLRELLTLLLRP